MKKNIVSILVAVLLTAILAGCSGGPAATDPADIKGALPAALLQLILRILQGKPLMAEMSVRLFPTDGWAFTAQITLMSMKKVIILM